METDRAGQQADAVDLEITQPILLYVSLCSHCYTTHKYSQMMGKTEDATNAKHMCATIKCVCVFKPVFTISLWALSSMGALAFFATITWSVLIDPIA